MKLIALTGAIASGKSSVAEALVERGYLYVGHADYLKGIVAEAVSNYGVPLTVDEIKAHKAQYRTLLQEFGSAIGFDSGDFIHDALYEAGWSDQAAVIDNVRTDGQAQAAKSHGFKVVRLNVSDHTRYERLLSQGVDLFTALKQEDHPIERGIWDGLIDYQISSDVLTPDGFAEFLIGLVEDEHAQANH